MKDLRKGIIHLVEKKKFVGEKGEKVSSAFMPLMNFLGDLRKKETMPILNFNRFSSIVRSFVSKRDPKKVTSILDGLGEVMYFSEIEALRDTVFLDPKVIIKAFNNVVSLKHKYVKNGILWEKDFERIWPFISPKFYPQLISFVKMFGIG